MDFVKRRLINAESVRLTAKAQVPRRATPGEIQPDWQAGTPQDNEGSQAVGQDRNNAADPEAGRQPYVRAAQAARPSGERKLEIQANSTAATSVIVRTSALLLTSSTSRS